MGEMFRIFALGFVLGAWVTTLSDWIEFRKKNRGKYPKYGKYGSHLCG